MKKFFEKYGYMIPTILLGFMFAVTSGVQVARADRVPLSGLTATSLSAVSPVTYNSSTGAFGFTLTGGAGSVFSTSAGAAYVTATSSNANPYTPAWRDGNSNLYVNNLIPTVTTVTAAGGTTVLTPASSHFQVLTGSNSQTFQLPNAQASGMADGINFRFENLTSAGDTLTVTDHSGNTVAIVRDGGFEDIFLQNNGTSNGTWDIHPYLANTDESGANHFGVGSTTPFARFSIQANSTDTNQYLFAIGSSTPTSTSTLAVITNQGKFGLGTSSPTADFSIAKGKSVLIAENAIATTTSITISPTNGSQQLIQIGTAATTLTAGTFSAGEKVNFILCNPNGTAGALTFSGFHYFGGTAPTQTTTANQCDDYVAQATQATSTTSASPIVFLAQAGAGLE